MYKIICPQCNSAIQNCNFKKHINSCNGKGTHRGKSRFKASDGLKCQFCGKESNDKNQHSNHERLCPLNKNRKYKNGMLGKTSHRKGLTKETSEEIKRIYEKTTYGPRKGSSRGKKGWYKGYWCDSSWELAWVIYNLDNNIAFTRNTEGFEYLFDNIKHKYFPDFKKEDVFIEIKGYFSEQVKAKINQFPFKLEVLSKEEMKPILEYVINKYGKDFIKLYEK